MSNENYSPSAEFNFNPITPDFIDHVLFKVSVAARERDIDPRHSVVIYELWQYRLYMIGETMLLFNESAERLNVVMDTVGHVRGRLNQIRETLLDGVDKTQREALIVEAQELLGNVEVAMAEATDG